MPGSRRSPSSRTWRATRCASIRRHHRARHALDRWSRPPARILPEVSQDMAEYTVRQLEKRQHRGAPQHQSRVAWSTVASSSPTARTFETDTVVWTAGVRPNPLLEATDLPLDDKKRLQCRADLRVDRRRRRLGRRRLRGSARPDQGRPGRAVRTDGTARGAAGEAAGRQHRGVDARQGRSRTTSTPTPARSRASACTAASPRSTASSSRASRPGSCTGPTT